MEFGLWGRPSVGARHRVGPIAGATSPRWAPPGGAGYRP